MTFITPPPPQTGDIIKKNKETQIMNKQPQNPRKIAAAIAKAIKSLDSVCWETSAQDYTGPAREKLFEALCELGYNLHTDYRLSKEG